MVGKRKKVVVSNLIDACDQPESEIDGSDVTVDVQETNALTVSTTKESEARKQFCFKAPKYEDGQIKAASKRPKIWKTLKQICAAERAGITTENYVTYSSIDAPPSFKPAKKYSDISGLPALYTDPHTKLRYATAEEYARIRVMPTDIVAGLLQLRRANNPAS